MQDFNNETEGIDQVINRQFINGLVNDMYKFGESKVWKFIKLDLDSRINYLELFLEAKKILFLVSWKRAGENKNDKNT